MKLNTITKVAVCLSLLATFGCTDKFEEINTNKEGITPKLLEQDFNNIKQDFAPIFNNIYIITPNFEWVFQLQENLNSDLWSGYMAIPTPFEGGRNNSTYKLLNNWNGYIWDYAYKNVMYNAVDIAKKSKGKFDQFYALSLILKVEGMHRVTDIFGPIIYSNYGKPTPTEYDSQEEVYKQFFKELDIAVDELTKRVDAGDTGESTFKTTDLSGYKGNYKQWVKFANTLRLRLAMRIVKVNPALAKEQAEKAIAQKFGVMESNGDSFKIISPNPNPLAILSDAWLDIRMSADMESIMGGYEDPRMELYFAKATDKDKKILGKYIGVRTGIDIVAKGDRQDYSGLGAVAKSNEIVLMPTAEAYFLRAEGALRGWNMGGGTAQSYYEQGITISFSQRDAAGVATYIADDTKLPKAYEDPKFPIVNNSPAVNNVTVAWDESASNEVKLQKIITQKWIAGFPVGQEAWSDYRRTGYPKLFPVLVNLSGGTIDSNLGVRRINFVDSEKSGNAGGVDTGVAKLGGPDNGGTRLWWDVNKGNF